jgi:secondary thiamine-phosphate synthase enzyme
MKQAQHTVSVETRGQGLYAITAEVGGWVERQGLATGLLSLFCQHTSASLTIQENADPDVLRDLQTFFARLVREDPALYRHADEGPDDMPAHIRSVLTGAQLSIPVAGRRLALGTWQDIYPKSGSCD